MANNPFELHVPALAERLVVASFRGRERISDAYRFDVTALRDGASGEAAAALDQAATLTLFAGDAKVRCVHGIVWRAEELGALGEGRRAGDGELAGGAVRLRIVPRAQRLRLRKQRRIFQDMSALDIAARLFADHAVPSVTLVRRPPVVRAYAVQYDETDWDFVRRLFAEEGYFFFFDHPLEGGEERLVVADSAQDQAPIHGDPHLRFERHAEQSAMLLRDDHVTELVSADRLRPEAALVRGWDFTRPNAPPESRLGTSESRLWVEHEGSYEADTEAATAPGLRPPAAVPHAAEGRLEQARRRALRASGTSLCRRLLPGHSFVLHGHDTPSLDRAWAVVAVTQEGRVPGVATGPRGEEKRPVWSCRFEACDAKAAPRPRWRGARPRQVAETALVVGPAGHEVYTDPFGRIKVQFHWDREGRMDERSSCFVRVAHSWAGAGWGTQMLPRIGMEVLVTFLGGDPDRPLVTGCVVNATHPPPFALPAHVTRSGLRSKTFGGPGYNEVSVDDAPGAEQIFVRAERDFLQETENNYTSHVKGGRLTTVAGGATDRVTGGSVVQVEGGRSTEVRGTDDLDVSGTVRRALGQDEQTEVAGSSSVTIKGRQSLDVRGGRIVIVGTEASPSASGHIVYGPCSSQATGPVSVQSDEGIRLSCGESTIELLKDRIVLYTPTLELRATKEMIATAKDGPIMTLGDDVEILAKKLRVFTDGAALELDQDAKIDGGKIKLGYDPSKPDKSEDEKQPETQKLECKLTDYYLEPYARKHYHVLVDGLRLEGDTDADGFVRVDIPKSATQATVRLWIDDYPEGRQQTYDLRLKDDLPAVDTILGGKWRLSNLGYYQGPRDGAMSAELRAAIAEFQDDHKDSHGLAATGDYDEGTQGALEEVHGS